MVKLIDCFLGRRNPKPTQFLLVSKWINKEASRILYRDNLFQFRGVEAWSDCYLFLRSTGLNKSNITKLDLDFSSFGNGNKHLTGIRMACIKLCKLPSLKTLQFGIGQDIMTREMLTLRKLKFDQLRGKVVLVAKEISYYYRYEFFKRPVRVRSEFIAVIGSWGWKFEGAFEPIELGHNHKFNDEGKWLADVRNEQKRNARTKRRMQYPL